MGKYTDSGFTFPAEFGFTGSARGSVNPRPHPTQSSDYFGDDAALKSASESPPTLARGGQVPGMKPVPKAAKAVLGALQIGKAIGQATAPKNAGMPVPGGPGTAVPPPALGGAPGALPGMRNGGKVDKWAKDAFKPSHKGRLHRALGVPEGKKIPEAKMEAAEHSKSPHLRHMAQAAHNINK